MPKFILVAGFNGAGKSTAIKNREQEFSNYLKIDPDQIEKSLNYPVEDKQKAQFEAGRESSRRIRTYLENDQSFLQESTLSGQQPIKLLKDAKQKGYETELIFVGLNSPNRSIERVAKRVEKGGHDIPQELLIKRYDKILENLPKALALSDKVSIFDNSRKKPILIISKENGLVVIHNNVPKYLKNACQELINEHGKQLDKLNKEPKDSVAYKDLSVNISRELESILDESMKGSKNTEHEKNIIKSEVVKFLVEAEKNQQINLEESLTKTKPELIKMVKELTNPKKIEKNKSIDLER